MGGVEGLDSKGFFQLIDAERLQLFDVFNILITCVLIGFAWFTECELTSAVVEAEEDRSCVVLIFIFDAK